MTAAYPLSARMASTRLVRDPVPAAGEHPLVAVRPQAGRLPPDQVQAHRDAAKGLRFQATEIPGKHFLDSARLLKEIGKKPQARIFDAHEGRRGI